MSRIDAMLAEIEARAEAAAGDVDTVIRRMARINQRADIPRLIAALREIDRGLGVIATGSDAMANCAAHYIARAEAILRGDDHAD